MSRAWFKFYGRDYRDGVRDLPFDVVGIYSVLLTLMYEEQGGRIRDHDQRLCRQIGCDIRMWRRTRKALIEAGKLHVTEDGFLTNDRVEIEAKSAEHLSEVRAISARSSRQLTDSDKPKSRKTKEPHEAIAPDLPLYARAFPESESEVPKEINSLGTPRSRKKSKRSATEQTLPAEPTFAMRRDAAEHGLANGSVEHEFRGWRDYHLARATPIADHEASFRTWLRNRDAFARPKHAVNGPRPAIFPNPYRG